MREHVRDRQGTEGQERTGTGGRTVGTGRKVWQRVGE